MPEPFALMSRPIRVTAAAKQALTDALYTSLFDEIDALLTIDGIEGTTTGFAVKLITGMQKESEAGWATLLNFTPGNLTSVTAADLQNASTKLLRYVRFEVTSLGGATAVVFDIGGMLRRRR